MANVEYKYPRNMDMKPGSKLHNNILGRIMDRAEESKRVMSNRDSKWDEIDDKLTSYIVLDQEDTTIRGVMLDKEKPIEVIVPTLVSVMDTLMAHTLTTFSEAPLFHYKAFRAQDQNAARLMELLVDQHVNRGKVLLNLMTMWRDAYAYGLGTVAVDWRKTYAWRRFNDVRHVTDNITGNVVEQHNGIQRKRHVQYEGNILQNVDPRTFYPDPDFPIQNIQDGQFVGWLTKETYETLLSYEQEQDSSYFNVLFLRDINNQRSRLVRERKQRNEIGYRDSRITTKDSLKDPFDVLHMYVRLVPSEWKLGKGTVPEIWLFSIANDEIILRAEPTFFDHNMFPVATFAPAFDGYTVAPISKLETVYGLANAVDWMYRARVYNFVNVAHNRFIVDPMLVRWDDVNNSDPAQSVRLREAAWGRGVQGAIEQIKVTDVTNQYMQDIVHGQDLIQRVSGAVDSLQGVQRTKGEVSATEARDTRLGAISRLDKDARTCVLQALQSVGYMFYKNVQQYMEQPALLELIGEDMAELQTVYAGQFAEIYPVDLYGDFDVVVNDNSRIGAEFLQEQLTVFQILQSHPETFQAFDFVRLAMDLYRRTGVRTPSEFLKADFRFHFKESAQAMDLVQQTNAVPVRQPSGGAPGHEQSEPRPTEV